MHENFQKFQTNQKFQKFQTFQKIPKHPKFQNIQKIILAKCPNTVWVSDGEELAEVSDIEVS